MYRVQICAAQGEQDTRVRDGISELKDDFDYLMDTIDKLDRDGSVEEALSVIESVSAYVNECISNSTDSI